MRACPPAPSGWPLRVTLPPITNAYALRPGAFEQNGLPSAAGGHRTRPEDFSPAVTRAGAELPLDLEKPVVLGEPLGAGERADFDLAGASCHRQVRDEAVLGLTRPGADDGAVTVFLRELDDFQGLGERPNLVRRHQSVACGRRAFW